MSTKLETLRRLGRIRAQALESAEAAHRNALEGILYYLGHDAAGGNVKRAAELTGVSRATIYNELARRQQTRDDLSSNGAPAPADEDLENGRRTTADSRLSSTMRRELLRVAEGHASAGRPRRKTWQALQARGLLLGAGGDPRLTRAGREAVTHLQ